MMIILLLAFMRGVVWPATSIIFIILSERFQSSSEDSGPPKFAEKTQVLNCPNQLKLKWAEVAGEAHELQEFRQPSSASNRHEDFRYHQQMAPPRGRKRSQGRKKIEMKLIADENARTVTFSKRRAGLFKKATELSILCGTQIALIIFSLAGRAYSFGHPDVESVVGRFCNRNPMPNLQDSVHGIRIHAAMLQQLKEQCDQKNEELEAKKRRGKEIEEALESSSNEITEERLNLLDIHQLKQLKEKLEKLRECVRGRANAPQVDESVEPPNSMNVTEPAIPGQVDLANVERDERDASPIPPDWLKL